MKNKNGQIFSTDIIIVVIIVLFGALFLVLNQISSQESGPDFEAKYKQAQTESKIVVSNLKSEEVISNENVINVDKLILLDEEKLRQELNIKNKFCIVFEKDNKLVKIDPDGEVYGIGSPEIKINDIPCK